MRLRVLLAVLALASTIALPTRAAAAQWPNSMAALGDSITAGFNSYPEPPDHPRPPEHPRHIPSPPVRDACPSGIGPFAHEDPAFGLDCPVNSWATGTGVQSIYRRILARNPAIEGHAFNDAITAAPVALLPAQAQAAVTQGAELVTVLIGANDACAPLQENGIQTPLAVFAAQFRQAMSILAAAPSAPRILVASIPDAYQVWQLFHADPNAALRWTTELLCPPLLRNATSTAPADASRRLAFRLRVAAYNLIEREICRQTPRCETDGGALFNTRLRPADIATLTNTGGIDAHPYDLLPVFNPPIDAVLNSTGDFWHPSVAGQNRLAEIVWAASSLGRVG
jgi:lysophospholipase L1-like esterase